MKKILKELMADANVTAENIAKAVKCSPASIYLILQGGTASLELTVRIADYFAVPLDLLCGRLSEKEANAILRNYGAYFMALRRAPYEAYLSGAKNQNRVCVGADCIVEPWPYNLLSDVFLKWDDTISPEQEDGLSYVLRKLPERQKDILILYYRDGLSLRDIQKKLPGSVEYIRKDLKKGICTLRSPAMSKIILLGVDGAQRESMLNRKLQEQRKIAEELESLEKLIKARQEALDKTGAPDASLRKAVAEMGLSTRAENVLLHGRCKTCADVVRLVEAGDLLKLRCCGEKTAKEIRDSLIAMGLIS